MKHDKNLSFWRKMSSTDILEALSSKFQGLTDHSENYLSIQDKSFKSAKQLLKDLYKHTKNEEKLLSWQVESSLPELVIKRFDDEQIWQQISIQNDGTINKLVREISSFLFNKQLYFLDADDVGSNEEDDDSVEDEESEEEGDGFEFGEDEPLEHEEDESDEGSLENDGDDAVAKKSVQFSSEVDDEFFKLCEMDDFCDQMEKTEDTGNLGVDLFGGDDGGSDEERELIRYKDFFEPSKSVKKNQTSSEKRVTFDEKEFSADENREQDGDDDDDDDRSDDDSKRIEINEESAGPKSSFESRQMRLKEKIKSLEEEALQEKPWHLKGEISSGGRPQNSLLEEYVDFDRASRPAPVFTEKTTLRLEDIIRQRMKDKSWDDVVRKVKPVENIREYRKKLVLDQEKSKVSLAEIYEQEYVKQRDAANSTGEPQDEKEPEEHLNIKKMMKSLFSKLDALSNFHYTPKPVEPEVKIISNIPAISMEEVAPVATSDAALLAPEEIKAKPKGDLKNKEERTSTDKKRERRHKKLKQREREKEKKKKEKILSKMQLGLGNKYSKEKAKRELESLTREKNVDRMVETSAKPVKSSTVFFNRLEDEVKSQMKKKNVEPTKRKKSLEKKSAKKLKL